MREKNSKSSKEKDMFKSGSLIRIDFDAKAVDADVYSLYMHDGLRRRWNGDNSALGEDYVKDIYKDDNVFFVVVSYEFGDDLTGYVLDILGSDGIMYTDCYDDRLEDYYVKAVIP